MDSSSSRMCYLFIEFILFLSRMYKIPLPWIRPFSDQSVLNLYRLSLFPLAYFKMENGTLLLIK